MERIHSDSNLGEKDFYTIRFLFDQQQFLPNQQKLLLELIFPVQFPKRMLYTNHPFSGYKLTMIYDRHPIKDNDAI